MPENKELAKQFIARTLVTAGASYFLLRSRLSHEDVMTYLMVGATGSASSLVSQYWIEDRMMMSG
jgi:hypothetical protein